MTVSSQTNKVIYIGNGIAPNFAIPFPFLEREHLKVHQLLNDIQTERTDWTVSGGNMVFETAPADGAQILIMREVPLTQETDYRENEVLPAETLERNFDKLTMQVQQLKEQADRAVTVDIFDNSDIKAKDLIPSIRQAVSDCARDATTAQNKAQEASTSATNAAISEANTAAMLGTKANVDADNLSVAGKKLISGLGFPSGRYIDLTLGASGAQYTAPANGYFVFDGIFDNYNYLAVSCSDGQFWCSNIGNAASWHLGHTWTAKEGTVSTLNYNSAFASYTFHFIYAEGDA